jgi:hypothetical protein
MNYFVSSSYARTIGTDILPSVIGDSAITVLSFYLSFFMQVVQLEQYCNYSGLFVSLVYFFVLTSQYNLRAIDSLYRVVTSHYTFYLVKPLRRLT